MLGRVCCEGVPGFFVIFNKIIKFYISEVKFHDDEWLVDNGT